MKIPHVHPDDLKWLRRWLRSNLTFAAVAVLLMIAMQYQPDMPNAPVHAATQVKAETEPARGTQLGQQTPQREKASSLSGWRRTTDGWEHVSTWATVGQSINELIATQREQEPAWVQYVFAKIRRVPPLMVALMQITAIALIVNVARSRRPA